MSEEDDILGEVPPEVKNIILRFAGLPQEEIVRIFQNKFKPINLYDSSTCEAFGLIASRIGSALVLKTGC